MLVLVAVHADPEMLRQNEVPAEVFAVAVFSRNLMDIAPSGRAVFLAAASVFCAGNNSSHGHGIGESKPEQRTRRARRPVDGRGLAECRRDPFQLVDQGLSRLPACSKAQRRPPDERQGKKPRPPRGFLMIDCLNTSRKQEAPTSRLEMGGVIDKDQQRLVQ